MNLVRLIPIALGLAVMMSVIPTSSALAFDATGNPVADAFLAGMEAAGARTLSVTSVEEDGENVVLNGFAAEMDKDGETSMLSAEKIAFENASVDTSDRIKAGSMTVENLAVEAQDGTFSAAWILATNLRLASPDDIRAPAKAPVDAFGYESIEMTDIEVSTEDEGTVPIRRVFSTMETNAGGPPRKGSFEIEGIEINPEHLDDEQTKEALADLGYAKLVLSMKAKGEWDIANARGILDVLEISGDEIGRFTLSASFGGLTQEIVGKLKRQNPAKGEMMALLQEITVESIDIRFDNNTLVERILDRQAKEANMDRAAFVDRMSESLPQILTLLQNPPFQQKIATALAVFLNGPKNLNINASPPQPVSISAVAGTVMVAPSAVPVLLGIDITANE